MKRMSEFQDALKKYHDAKAIVDTAVEGDWKSMAGRLAMQSRTRDGLPELQAKVMELAGRGVSIVIPEGAGTEKFCAIATKRGFLVVNGDVVYRRVADYVWQGMNKTGVNQFGLTNYSMLLDEVGSMMTEMGMYKAESPNWNTPAVIADYDALLEYIKGIVNRAPGLQFVAQFVMYTIVESALRGTYDIGARPVVVKNLAPEVARLVGVSSKTVTTNGRLGLEFVLESLGATKDEVKRAVEEK
jgi:hypothetical protein